MSLDIIGQIAVFFIDAAQIVEIARSFQPACPKILREWPVLRTEVSQDCPLAALHTETYIRLR